MAETNDQAPREGGPLPKKARRNAIYIPKGSDVEKQIFQIGINHVLSTEVIPQMAVSGLLDLPPPAALAAEAAEDGEDADESNRQGVEGEVQEEGDAPISALLPPSPPAANNQVLAVPDEAKEPSDDEKKSSLTGH